MSKSGRQPQMTKDKFSQTIPFFLLSLVALIIYAPALSAGFQFDDMIRIILNKAVHNPFDIQSIWDNNARRFVANWSFALNYHYSQNNPFSYHLVNILFHLGASFLIYSLTKLTVRSAGGNETRLAGYANQIAFFSALLFLVHPINTQAVSYVVQRSTVLATFFYIGALYFAAEVRHKNRPVFLITALAFAAAAIFSKEIALTLPFTLFLYMFYFHGTDKKEIAKSLRLALLFFIPIAVLFFSDYLGRILSSGLRSATSVSTGLARDEYLYTQFNVIRTYLRFLFIPAGQNLDPDYPVSAGLFELRTFLSFLFLSGLFSAGILLFKKYRIISFGIIFFFIALSIESSIIPISDVINEHRLYLPFFGFTLSFLSFLYLKINQQKALSIFLCCVLILFSFLTFNRNKVWKNELTLWQDVVAKSPEKGRGHFALGNAYMNRASEGENREAYVSKAIEHYKKAVEFKLPQLAPAHNSLAIAYTFKGDFENAIKSYKASLAVKPDYAEAARNLAIVQKLVNAPPRQRADFIKELRFAYLRPESEKKQIHPEEAKSMYAKGHKEMEKGNFSDAIQYYKQAVVLNPEYAEGFNSLAIAHTFNGELEEALVNYSKALRLKPDYHHARQNMTVLQALINKPEEEKQAFIKNLKHKVG